MEAKLTEFFANACRPITDHLLPGAKLLVTVGEDGYFVTVDDERVVTVTKNAKEAADMEIKGTEEAMADIFSSSDPKALSIRMNHHVKQRTSPKVSIFLERTVENARYFQRGYYHFLREMNLLK
jgi:hypothetical protein